MTKIMSAFSIYREQRYFRSLDGVRFFSILAVIWHHSVPANLPEVFSRGFLGVDMFFVLSGYLIVTLLLREKTKNNQSISLKNFYIRRALRIFPVYFGVLFALSMIYGLVKVNDPDSEQFFSILPIYLVFLANWSLVHAANLGIYWSLATEEQFYIVWPVIEKLCRPKTILFILGIFLIINQAVNFGYLNRFFMWLYQQNTPVDLHILDTTFTPICLGVLLAHALNNKTTFNYLSRLFCLPWTSIAVGLLLLVLISLFSGDISGLPRLVIQLTMCLWLLTLVIREDHYLKPLMSFPLIKRLGQISYGMYVYHMFALHIVRELLARYGIEINGVLFIAGLFLTALIAEVSYRFYESPFLTLNKRFRAIKS
ncbi:acyltransferase 3 [gamma proteobacterium IMCC1989]|nr:acyltransferase 3 [gamma proteobacterium IMCC1989]